MRPFRPAPFGVFWLGVPQKEFSVVKWLYILYIFDFLFLAVIMYHIRPFVQIVVKSTTPSSLLFYLLVLLFWLL
jgi:hypothetical protein